MNNKIIPIREISLGDSFTGYEMKFKALSDQKRLHILNLLCNGPVSVAELCERVGMPQSKLSYHLKILLDANLILKENKGTWSYHKMNEVEVNHLLSPQLCCLFRSNCC